MAATAARPKANLTLGILLTVLAFLSVAVMSALGKAATEQVASEVVTFFQSSISLLLVLPLALRQGLIPLRTQHLPLHLVRGVAGLLSQLLMFVSLNFIPLVDSVLLANAAPLFIPIVMWVWLRQHVAPRIWACLLVGFVGIVVILQPGAAVVNPGIGWAIAAGFFSAVALVAVRLLDRTEPAIRILFYYFLISTIITLPLLVLNWPRPDPRTWLFLLGVGITMALAQYLLILAYDYASPSQTSPFNYSVVIFSALIGWLVWGQAPNALSGQASSWSASPASSRRSITKRIWRAGLMPTSILLPPRRGESHR
jgi:drug/metabolite transporter (DMT)-like permease